MKAPLKTMITSDRQRYHDRAVHVLAKVPAVLEASVAAAFGREVVEKPPIVVRHERVHLRWMTSDGKGGLKPRDNHG